MVAQPPAKSRLMQCIGGHGFDSDVAAATNGYASERSM